MERAVQGCGCVAGRSWIPEQQSPDGNTHLPEAGHLVGRVLLC